MYLATFSLSIIEGIGLPQWLSGKESTCNAGDMGLISGSGRSPRGGHGNPLQYSCLEKPMDRGAWRASVHGVQKELDTTAQLTNKTAATTNKEDA